MRIGFANGVFDGAHAGHKHFLGECLSACDYLIVAVNSDASVKHLKGKDRPIRPLSVRMKQVSVYADAVIPFDGNERPLIEAIKPDVIFKGYDHPSTGLDERVQQISHLPGYSTTSELRTRT